MVELLEVFQSSLPQATESTRIQKRSKSQTARCRKVKFFTNKENKLRIYLENVLVPELGHYEDLSPSESRLLHGIHLTTKLDLRNRRYKRRGI